MDFGDEKMIVKFLVNYFGNHGKFINFDHTKVRIENDMNIVMKFSEPDMKPVDAPVF